MSAYWREEEKISKLKKNQTQKKKKRSKKLKMGELPLLYLHEKGLYEIE